MYPGPNGNNGPRKQKLHRKPMQAIRKKKKKKNKIQNPCASKTQPQHHIIPTVPRKKRGNGKRRKNKGKKTRNKRNRELYKSPIEKKRKESRSFE
jgi:hypothetical protein